MTCACSTFWEVDRGDAWVRVSAWAAANYCLYGFQVRSTSPIRPITPLAGVRYGNDPRYVAERCEVCDYVSRAKAMLCVQHEQQTADTIVSNALESLDDFTDGLPGVVVDAVHRKLVERLEVRLESESSCEHGIAGDDYCEACNKEMKRARHEAGLGD
jgi:hypothetical protein